MVTTLSYPQNNNPLSYAHLNGEWAQWFRTAQRFEYKVPAQDRGDIRHTIILELALARARDGNKPFSEALMYRIASYVVSDYWRKEKRKPTILSLDTEIDNGDGDTCKLMDTLVDGKAIDLDARTFLLGCPHRLVQIAYKKTSGIALTNADMKYLCKWRKKEQKQLICG